MLNPALLVTSDAPPVGSSRYLWWRADDTEAHAPTSASPIRISLKQIVFGGNVAAHVLHATLQMGRFSATEEELNQTKYSKIGVYEQGRLISKPPPSATRPPLRVFPRNRGLAKEFAANKSAFHASMASSHNSRVELLYQRSTRRARSVFQWLALPIAVPISNGIRSR